MRPVALVQHEERGRTATKATGRGSAGGERRAQGEEGVCCCVAAWEGGSARPLLSPRVVSALGVCSAVHACRVCIFSPFVFFKTQQTTRGCWVAGRPPSQHHRTVSAGGARRVRGLLFFSPFAFSLNPSRGGEQPSRVDVMWMMMPGGARERA